MNSTPNETYNLVVIGAGSAGLAAAIGAAELGAKVALVERKAVPEPHLSVQMLADTARNIARARQTSQQFFKSESGALDFTAVHTHLSSQAHSRSAPNLDGARSKGVECIMGEARFLDQSTIEVGGRRLMFSRALIATGSRVALSSKQALTPDDLLKITTLPEQLAVIGSSADAVAIAQSFARFGSKVTLIDSNERLLPRHESRAAKIITDVLLREGIQFKLSAKSLDAEISGSIGAVIHCTPRKPQLDVLNLDAAKVACNADGTLCVHEKFQTTNPRIFACGGVMSQESCVHESEAQARYVIGNALFMASHAQSDLVSPRIVYTDPEIASVALTLEDPATESLEHTVLDHPDQGFIRIIHNRKGDILGATIVAPKASELIGEIVLAINHEIKLGSIGSDIHPHGTLSEFIKQCGDIQHRKLLTPKLAKSLSRYLKWRR